MISISHYLLFVGANLLMAITPGPNMIYLFSRALCQGCGDGLLSWSGVTLGFLVHMVCASVGLTTLFMAVPLAYDILKVAGALYLLWLACQAVRPGARSPLEACELEVDSPRRLFTMGLLTSVLNPKVAMFYLTVLSQFITSETGSIMVQSLTLGVTHSISKSFVSLLSRLAVRQHCLRLDA